MSGSIRQTVVFDAGPERVFEALMDSKKHAAFTGAPARISRKVGGAISAHSNFIAGYNLHLVKNRAIVQAWRGSNWPKESWSVASFLLESARGGKTKLTFEQHGVPKAALKGIAAGWRSVYWEPLHRMLKAAAGGPTRPAKTKARKRTTARARNQARS